MVKSDAKKYLVKVKRGRRWVTTIWTGHVRIPGAKGEGLGKSYTGKPVSRKAAEGAMARAQDGFPDEEFRVVEAPAAPAA